MQKWRPVYFRQRQWTVQTYRVNDTLTPRTGDFVAAAIYETNRRQCLHRLNHYYAQLAIVKAGQNFFSLFAAIVYCIRVEFPSFLWRLLCSHVIVYSSNNYKANPVLFSPWKLISLPKNSNNCFNLPLNSIVMANAKRKEKSLSFIQ